MYVEFCVERMMLQKLILFVKKTFRDKKQAKPSKPVKKPIVRCGPERCIYSTLLHSTREAPTEGHIKPLLIGNLLDNS